MPAGGKPRCRSPTKSWRPPTPRSTEPHPTLLPTAAALDGAWVSQREPTLAYWEQHYPWVKDKRLVEVRSEALGQMQIHIDGDRFRLIGHPCYGEWSTRFSIARRDGARYVLATQKPFEPPIEFATLERHGGLLWSIVGMADQEVREAFARTGPNNNGPSD